MSRYLRRLGFYSTLIFCSLLIPLSVVSPSAALNNQDAGSAVLQISGRGAGHGRGLSQYGALGYASIDHWTANEILNHYYGGTSSGQIPVDATVNAESVRVDLSYMHDRATAVSIAHGGLELSESDGSTLELISQSAARLQIDGNGFRLETSASCRGPWSAAGYIDAKYVKIQPRTSKQPNADQASKDNLLRVCGAKRQVWYEGSVEAINADGRARTTNTVPVERYLRGVVPGEVIASWPEATLQAQAVAARSYLMAGDFRQLPYADTCDNTRCQVYNGVFSTHRSGGVSTHPRTDKAIAATDGVVRLRPDGSVARTEYSASSGGHTVGGDFPEVPDHGDAHVSNPHHTWTAVVDTERLVAHYGLGNFRGLEITKRSGVGADGGRVVEAVFRFADGSVKVDGGTARRRLGLRSSWFTVT